MSIRWNTGLVAAKIESVYGTDPTPIGTDVMLTRNVTIDDAYAGDALSRNLDQPYLGNDEEINPNPHVIVSFEVELSGAGSAGDIPRYGCLLKAAGFDETPDATTPTLIEYTPSATLEDSVTLYFERGGQRHIVKGARGNVSFQFPQRGFPFMRFTMTGLYTRPAAGSLTPDWDGIPVPLPVNEANTALTLGTYSGPVMDFSLDMGSVIYPRNVINSEEILLTDRAPSGSITIEQPAIGSLNVFSAWVETHAGTIPTVALAIQHGSTAGKIIELEAPRVQPKRPREQNDQGISNYAFELGFLPDEGNDEVLLTVR